VLVGTDRDLLAQSAGEELSAMARGCLDARAVHAARRWLYLELRRGHRDTPSFRADARLDR